MRCHAISFLLLPFLAACSLITPKEPQQKVDEFVILVDKTVPIELLYKMNLQTKQLWPLDDQVSRQDISSNQRACVRSYFLSKQTKTYKLRSTRNYALKRETAIDRDIKILKNSIGKKRRSFSLNWGRCAMESFSTIEEMIQFLIAPEYSKLRHILLLYSTHRNDGISKNMIDIKRRSFLSCGITLPPLFNLSTTNKQHLIYTKMPG